MSWLFALIGLALGGLAGYLLARRFGDSEQRASALQQELDAAREEHAAYRREVSDHFAKTAVAVNQLTESYRSVHQQLSDGAHALCDNAAAETALAFDQSRLIDAPDADTPSGVSSADSDDTPSEPDARTPGEPTVEEAAQAPEPDESSAAQTTSPAETTTESEPESETDPVAPRAGNEDEEPQGPSESGGASWTPASSTEASEPPRPPRDYAEEEAGATRG